MKFNKRGAAAPQEEVSYTGVVLVLALILIAATIGVYFYVTNLSKYAPADFSVHIAACTSVYGSAGIEPSLVKGEYCKFQQDGGSDYSNCNDLRILSLARSAVGFQAIDCSDLAATDIAQYSAEGYCGNMCATKGSTVKSKIAGGIIRFNGGQYRCPTETEGTSCILVKPLVPFRKSGEACSTTPGASPCENGLYCKAAAGTTSGTCQPALKGLNAVCAASTECTSPLVCKDSTTAGTKTCQSA